MSMYKPSAAMPRPGHLLRGRSVTLKTACSSSGLALHQALQSIRLGEVSSALVAGANLLLAPGLAVTMSATQALSPTGSCKTFDASADGYARAEGVSCLYIKRLDKAIRDGNPIRAVIRASSSNADGKTAGLTVPNPAAQEALIRQAYKNAGLELCHTPVIECHGTGTTTGDPLEVSAIASCFGEHGAYIGSVKPNLGHSEGALALTSILKAVVALEHQTVIPNIKFTTPNPASKLLDACTGSCSIDLTLTSSMGRCQVDGPDGAAALAPRSE